MCAVMVDHLTAFLCIAAGVCVLRYLKRPVLGNGILCAVCCGCAILSKYSAGYTPALPFLAVLCLRRFELLRKPGILVQPLVVALVVAPWAIWTSKLSFYGLPGRRGGLAAARAASFVVGTLQIFPPVLMVVVLVGLIALLFRPREWPEGLAVLGLVCAGHLAFLTLSPVGTEPRYLLAPAGALLVLSFVGWFRVLGSMLRTGRWASAVPALAAILTVALVGSHWGDYARPPHAAIRSVVEFVVKQQGWAARGVVAPPNLEGPVIAEFVAQDRHRPGYRLLRPSKILARSNWFGRKYSSTFGSAEAMMEYFRQHPVSAIMWNEPFGAEPRTHVRLMNEMLLQNPLRWRRAAPLGSAAAGASSWAVYEYVPPRS
jgi:hypothetical protein